ncbi:MAG: hypothetical protein PUB21_10300 [Bacteroidales bacterium]|nr:hypothetical protein [Bacteroidales bacterium]
MNIVIYGREIRTYYLFGKRNIDDIELSRLDAQSILLKSTRLTRYVDNEEIRKWLRFEMQGYSSKDEVSLRYMSKTRRWTDKEKGEGYWVPLAQIVAMKESSDIKLKGLSIPNTDIPVIASNASSNMNITANNIAKYEGIKSTILSLIHDFATSVYYERVFDGLAESIFDSYKKEVDLLIAENTGDVLEKIPYVINSLSNEEPESISQALNTCRRIIDAFADNIFPATDDTIEVDGNSVSLKKDKVKNRLTTYVSQNCDSTSRVKKIRDNLSNLYDRVSSGVHNDIDCEEAKSLFFNTYLILGEILTLKK